VFKIAKYPLFHAVAKDFVKKNKDMIFDGRIVPHLILWVKFDKNTKNDFLEQLKGFDYELYEEFREYFFEFDESVEIIPINFTLVFLNEEEALSFFRFLKELPNIINIGFYSLISDVFVGEEEDKLLFPSVFSEEKEGNCYLTIFDKDMNEIEELSGIFDKHDEEIQELRLSFFKKGNNHDS